MKHRYIFDAPPRRTRVRWARLLLVVSLPLAVVLLATFGLRTCAQRRSAPQGEASASPALPLPDAAPPAQWVWRNLHFPTDQTNLLGGTGAFQPTASGNPESGLFGSVRTASRGGRLWPSFHEGLDIACLARDRRGNPLDKVYAVADGTVAYANRVAGNSNYGRYVVLMHPDGIGEVFTLYAHLESIENGVRPGAEVRGGTVLGIMGHSSSDPIPLARAHLHFEVGLMLNSRFDRWFREQKLKPDHGPYHGWNLLGFQPLDFFRVWRDQGMVRGSDLLAATPPAFQVILRTPERPEIFTRHPGLWRGPAGTPLVVAASENGVPLWGRAATAEEVAKLGRAAAAELETDPAVLGRNGRRLVVLDKGSWRLGENGEEWVTLLTYPQRVRNRP